MALIQNSFHAVDYLVFSISLAISVFIGVFFAFRGKKKNTQVTQGEYLLADRKMPILPVAISIQVSYMSAILILGTPAEMYTQGTQYFMSVFGQALGITMATLIFVPLVYPLRTTSVFEYLELRFKSVTARLVGTFLTVFTQVIYMGIASFAPSTALEAVTGFPVWASIILINVLTTFYTTIGGIKGVIWTDVFQALVMLIGMVAVLIQGAIKVGGLDNVWRINDEYGRLNFFDFDPDPRQRHSIWSLVIGSSITWMGTYGVFQTSFQRYSTVPTINNARFAMFLNIPGAVFYYTIACLSGISVFAYYVMENCDPLAKQLVDNPNQIIPFFVMETLSYPAIPGLFLSSLFAGALSSISSALNALAALAWEDVFKRHFESKWSESKKMLLTRSIVVLCGCLSTVVGIIVQNLEGTVVQMVVGLIGAGTGPMLGMFFLGGLFPWANAAGAVVGGIVSFAVCLWIAMGAYATGLTKDRFRSPNGTCSQYLGDVVTTTMSSPVLSNTTTTDSLVTMGQASDDGISGIEELYTISYLWYAAIGLATCVIVGLIVSFITGANKFDDIPTKYQIPLATRLFCCLPRSWQNKLNCNRHFDYVADSDNEDKEDGKQHRDSENGNTAHDNNAFVLEPARQKVQSQRL